MPEILYKPVHLLPPVSHPNSPQVKGLPIALLLYLEIPSASPTISDRNSLPATLEVIQLQKFLESASWDPSSDTNHHRSDFLEAEFKLEI